MSRPASNHARAAVSITRRAFTTLPLAASAATRPLNFVFILADDLGYGDLGCYGSTRNLTPALDRLAAESARLTHHYSLAPVCSPARAGLLTGLIPQRTGITGVLRDDRDDAGLPDLPTIPSTLRRLGYHTALIGKWHLGMSPSNSPNARGFDEFWGFLSGTIDYNTHLSLGGGGRGQRSTYHNATPIQLSGYFPDLATAQAVRYVESARAPFFLSVSLALPHTPLQVPESYAAPFRGRMPDAQATYAGMLASIDHSFAQLRAALERSGHWPNTVVIFSSDNGWVKKRTPNVASAGSNDPLRGGKYELYEGGIRVPCLVRWPGLTRPGSVLSHPTWFADWFPTITNQPSRDGINLRPFLQGRKPRPRDLFWSFEDPLVQTPLSFALRRGDWKLLQIGSQTALYNLAADPSEQHDQSAAHPQLRAALLNAIRRQEAALVP